MVPNLARTVPSGSCVLQLQHARLSKTTAMKAAQSAHPVDDSVILDRIRQQFDGRAGKYDAESNNYHSMLAQQLLSLCDLQPGQQVLDLASGTGMVALPAAAAVGPDGRVVAVDLSEAMLAQAKAKAEAQRLQGRMEFIVGDMEKLEACLPQDWLASFDAVTCSAAVPFLRDPLAALNTWRRWLAPGSGKLAFNTFTPPAIEEFGLFRKMAAECGFPEEVDPCDALGSEELVKEAMQAANYVTVEVIAEQKERLMPAASPEAHAEKIWQVALNNNPFSTLRPEGQQQALEAFHDAFIAAAVQELKSSGRFDAQQQQVLNRYTMLRVLGTV